MTAKKIGAMSRAEAAALGRAAMDAKTPPMPLRFWIKVKRGAEGECWPWMAGVKRKEEGYGAFYLDGRNHPAHRVAWMLSNGPIPAGWVVCHHCDNPPCCNPTHLFIGTPQDNDADRVAKGRQSRGSRHSKSVLTEEAVVTLRARARELGSIKQAALEAGVNYFTAWSACKRNWKHVG